MTSLVNELINEHYGVKYFDQSDSLIITANQKDLYYYTSYIGQHQIEIERGDSAYIISGTRDMAHVVRGPAVIQSQILATVIRGYVSDNKSAELSISTHLPYINGCSTKQIFTPIRPGDPTLQMLYMPSHTCEQAHHVHSTVRVVYVLSGSGRCIVGTKKYNFEHHLRQGTIAIFERMCPHHFETDESDLVVLPLHIYSSIGAQEYNHPMFNGTHKVFSG